MKLFARGAQTGERVVGYIRDHFVRDFVRYEDKK